MDISWLSKILKCAGVSHQAQRLRTVRAKKLYFLFWPLRFRQTTLLAFPLCFLSFSQSLSCVSLNRLLEEMLNYWVFQKDVYLCSWRQIKLNVIRIGLKIVFQHHLRSIIFIQWRWSDIDVCLKNICNILEKLNRLTIITTYPNKKAAIWNRIWISKISFLVNPRS